MVVESVARRVHLPQMEAAEWSLIVHFPDLIGALIGSQTDPGEWEGRNARKSRMDEALWEQEGRKRDQFE